MHCPASYLFSARRNTIRSRTFQEEDCEFLRKHGVETNVMFWIEAPLLVESRLQRSLRGGQYSRGVAPGW